MFHFSLLRYERTERGWKVVFPRMFWYCSTKYRVNHSATHARSGVAYEFCRAVLRRKELKKTTSE